MTQTPFQRRAVRMKLAELLKEPLDRLANDTRLRKLGRYDTDVARELLRVFGLQVSEDKLQALERVKDLLEVAEGAGPLLTAPPTPVPDEPSALESLVATSVPRARAIPPAPAGTFVSSLAYDTARIGAAAVYCSDGRVGEQMDQFLHEGLSLPRYDRVACPGGPAALAGRLMAFWECRGVEDQLRFLVRAHGLKQVVLIAHQDCAYYRERLGIGATVLEEEQRRDLTLAAACVARLGDGLQVTNVFARNAAGQIRFEPCP